MLSQLWYFLVTVIETCKTQSKPAYRQPLNTDTSLLQTVCFVPGPGLLIFRGKKSKISRDFHWQIRGKIGRFCGIFAGKKSKFAEQSAEFRRFSREKSQNSQKNRPISRVFSGKKSIFEGFSGANNFLRIS